MRWYEIKEKFLYFLTVAGVVLFWAGVWDGVGRIWILSNPFVSFIFGLILFFTVGKIFKDADPFGHEGKGVQKIMKGIVNHPKRHEMTIHYRDHIKNKEVSLSGKNLNRAEKDFLVFKENGRENFVPFHRLSRVKHDEIVHWKK